MMMCRCMSTTLEPKILILNGYRPPEPSNSSLGIPLDPSRPYPGVDIRPEVMQRSAIHAGVLLHIYLEAITDQWLVQGVKIIQDIEYIPSESFQGVGMLIAPRFPQVAFFSSWSLPWGLIKAMDIIVQSGDEDTNRRDLTRYEMTKRAPPYEIVGSFVARTDYAADHGNATGSEGSTGAPVQSSLQSIDGTNPPRTMNGEMTFDSTWTGVPMSIKDIMFVLKDLSKEIWKQTAMEAIPDIPPPFTLQRDPADRNSAWITLQILDLGPDEQALNWVDLADALRRVLQNHVISNRYESQRHFLIDDRRTQVARIEYSKGRPRGMEASGGGGDITVL